MERKNLDKVIEILEEKGFLGLLFAAYELSKIKTKAVSEFRLIEKENEDFSNKNLEFEKKIPSLESENKSLKEREIKLEADNKTLSDRIRKLDKQISDYETSDEAKQKEQDRRVSELLTAKDSFNSKEERILQEKEESIESYFKNLKESWENHENEMIERLQNFAEKKGYERSKNYFVKEDFSNKVSKGSKPDFSFKIGKQFVIFDAKKLDLLSKVNDEKDPELKKQKLFKLAAEKVKSNGELLRKYLSVKNVNSLMYEIVPLEVLPYLKETRIQLNKDFGEVQVIAIEHVPTIIELLERIEGYDNLADIDPKERDKIAQVIANQMNVTNKFVTDNLKNSRDYFQIIQKSRDLLSDDMTEKISTHQKITKTDKKLLDEFSEVTGNAAQHNLLEVKLPEEKK